MFHRWQLLSVLALGAAGILLMPGSSFGQVPTDDYEIGGSRFDVPDPGFPSPARRDAGQASSAAASRSYFQPPAGYQAFYAPAPLGNAVLVTVQVPERNAEIWIDGSRTRQTGTVRRFLSPPISPGSNYTYDIQVKWVENGRTVEQTRTVHVRAGARVNVDFNTQASNDQRPSQPKGGS